jgi:argininosuccinate synthase
LIAKRQIEIARATGARQVARRHRQGNDQVRVELTIGAGSRHQGHRLARGELTSRTG